MRIPFLLQPIDYPIGFQGIYYFVTAVWPLVHVQSFEWIAGFKPDKFQFYTTTLLILAISLALLSSIGRKKTVITYVLSISSAIAFMVVEVWFHDVIKPVFFLDFTLEFLISVSIIYFLWRQYVTKHATNT